MPIIKQVKPVKSKAIHTDWLKNASRSIGGQTVNVLKSYAPNVSSILGSTASVAKKATQIKKPMSERQAEQKLNSNKYVKAVDKAFKNALTDLKQGYVFGNDDRAGSDDLDSMFEDAAASVSFGDAGESTVNYINAAPSATALNGIGESIVSSAEMNVKMTKAQTDAQIAVMGTSMAQMSQISNAILTSLSGIENNLAALVEYNNTNMNNYIESATAYFEKIGAAQEEKDDSPRAVDLSQIMSGGKFDMQAYKKYVKNNLRKQFSTADSILSMMDDGMLDMIADNPLGMIPEVVIGYAMPQILQTSVKGMEEVFNSAMPAMMAGLQAWGQEQGNSLVGGLIKRVTNVLGFDTGTGDSFFSADDIKINRGAIPFDGDTKNYITHVIPSLLSESTAYLKNISGYIEEKRFQEKLNTTQNDANTVVDRDRGEIYHYAGDPNKLQKLTRQQKAYYNKHRDEIDRDPDLMRQFYEDRRITSIESSASNNARIADNRQVWNVDKNRFESVDDLVQSTRESFLDAIRDAMQNLNFGKRVQEAIGGDETMQALNNVFNVQRLNHKDDYGYNTQLQEAILSAAATRREGKSIGMDNAAYKELAEAVGYDRTKTGKFDKKSTSNKDLDRTINAYLEMMGNILETDPLANMEFRATGQFAQNALNNKQRQILSQEPTTALATVDKLTDVDPMTGERISIEAQTEKTATDIFKKRQASAYKQREINGTVNSEYDLSGAQARIDNSQYGREARELFNMLGKQATDGGKNFVGAIMNGDKKGMYAAMGQTFGAMATTVMGSMNEHFFKPISNMLFGERGDNGYIESGLFAGTENAIIDMTHEVSYRITGKPYKDSKGVEHPADPNAVTGQIKSAVGTVLFGEEQVDEEGNFIGKTEGLLSVVTDTVKKGLVNWHNQLFGNFSKDGEEVNEDNVIQLIKGTVSDNLADAAVGAAGGAAVGLASGGLLGALIGGPIGGAAIGAAAGILNKNEAFQKWLFGDPDKDNGFISKSTQNFINDNKNFLMAGGALGTVAGTVSGAGFLGTMVGGPVGGALLGLAGATIAKSEMFHNFLFGDEESGRPGIIRQFQGIFKKSQQDLKDNMPTRTSVGSALVGAAGGALTAGVIGKVGILGAMLTPAGPIGGALIGLGLGIRASSDSFQKFLFGNGEEKGSVQYQAGIFGQFKNMLMVDVLYPMRNQFTNMVNDVGATVKYEILDTVEALVEPVSDLIQSTVGRLGSFIGEGFDKFFGIIGDKAGAPIVRAVETAIVKPIMTIGGLLTRATTKIVTNAIAMPFRIARHVANAITSPFLKVAHSIAGGIAKLGTKFIAGTIGKAVDKATHSIIGPILTTAFGGAKGIASFAYNNLRDRRTTRKEERQKKRQEKYDAEWGGGKEGRMNRSREAYKKAVKRGTMRRNTDGRFISYDEYIQDRARADYDDAMAKGKIDPNMSIEDFINSDAYAGDTATFEQMMKESRYGYKVTKGRNRLNARQLKQREKNQKQIAKWTGYSYTDDTEANRAIAEAKASAAGVKLRWGTVDAEEERASVKLEDGAHMNDKALMRANPAMLTAEARNAQTGLKLLEQVMKIANKMATDEEKANAEVSTEREKEDRIAEYESEGKEAPDIFDAVGKQSMLGKLKKAANGKFSTDKTEYAPIVTWLRENGKIRDNENIDAWSVDRLFEESIKRGGTDLVDYLEGMASQGREEDRALTKDSGITLARTVAQRKNREIAERILRKGKKDPAAQERLLNQYGWKLGPDGQTIMHTVKKLGEDGKYHDADESVYDVDYLAKVDAEKDAAVARMKSMANRWLYNDDGEEHHYAKGRKGKPKSKAARNAVKYAQSSKNRRPAIPIEDTELALVGEEGPELAVLDNGASVLPANETRPINTIISGIAPELLENDEADEQTDELIDEVRKLNETESKVAENTEATKTATERSAEFADNLETGKTGMDTDNNGTAEPVFGPVNESAEAVADRQRENDEKQKQNAGSYQKLHGVFGKLTDASSVAANAAADAASAAKNTKLGQTISSGLSTAASLGKMLLFGAVASAFAKSGGVTVLGNALSSGLTFVANNLPTIISTISSGVSAVGNFIVEHGAAIAEGIVSVVEGVGKVVTVLGDIGSSVLSIAGKLISGSVSGVGEYADSYIYSDEHSLTTDEEDKKESDVVQVGDLAEAGASLALDVGGSVTTYAANKAAKEAAETATKQGALSAVKETAENITTSASKVGSLAGQGADASKGKTLITKAIDAVESGLYTFFNKCASLILGKSIDETTIGKLVSKVVGSVNTFISTCTTKIYNMLLEKLTTVFGAETAAYIASAGTGFVVNLTFTAIANVGGTAKLFYVNEEDVDAGMDLIAAAFVVLKSIPYVGSILEILDALMTMNGNTGILTGMAYVAYDGIYGLFIDDAASKLDEATSKFKEEYEDYNTTQLYDEYDALVAAGLSPTDENGAVITREQYAEEVIAGTRSGSTTSYTDYNSKENKDLGDTVASGAWGLVSGAGKTVGGGVKAVGNSLAKLTGRFTYHYYDSDQTNSGNIYIKDGKKWDVFDSEGNSLSDEPLSSDAIASDIIEGENTRRTTDLTSIFGENASKVELDQDNGVFEAGAKTITGAASTVGEGIARIIDKGSYAAEDTITYYNDTTDECVYIKNGDTWDKYDQEGVLQDEGLTEDAIQEAIQGASVKGLTLKSSSNPNGVTELEANRRIFADYDSEATGSSENDWTIGKSYDEVKSDVVGLEDGWCWLDSNGCYYTLEEDGTYTYRTVYGDALIKNISQDDMTSLVVANQLIMCQIKDATGAKATATNMYEEMYNSIVDGYKYENEGSDTSTTTWTKNEDGTYTGTTANGEIVSNTATEEEVQEAVSNGEGTVSDQATVDTNKKTIYYLANGNYWIPNEDGTYSLISGTDGSVLEDGHKTITAENGGVYTNDYAITEDVLKSEYGVEVTGDGNVEAKVASVSNSTYTAYESANISSDGYGHNYTYTVDANGETFTKREGYSVISTGMTENEVKAEVDEYTANTEANPDDAYIATQKAASQTAYTEDEQAKLDKGYVWEKTGDASINYEYQPGSNSYAEISLDSDNSVSTGYSLDNVRERASLVEPVDLDENYYDSTSGYVLHGNKKSVYQFYDIEDTDFKKKKTYEDSEGNKIKKVKKGTMTEWYREGRLTPLDEYKADTDATIVDDENTTDETEGGSGEGVSVKKRGTTKVKHGGGYGSKLSSKNGFTYASQEDSRWADTKYEYNNDGGTMADSGCGPTAMSMVVSNMTGNDVTPTDMAQLAADTGNRDATGTNWNYISDAANSYGLNSTQTLNPNTDDILESVSSGNPVVLSGTSSGITTPYTSAGHYVVGVGLDNNGNVLVNDPRGTQYSRAYSPEELASYTASAWEIDGGYGNKRNRSHKFRRGGRGETYYYLSNGMYYVPTTVNGKTIYKLYTSNGKLVTKSTSNYEAAITESQLKELLAAKTVTKKTAKTTQSSSVLNGGTSNATADMYSDSNGNYYKKNSDGTYSYYTKDGTLQKTNLTALKVGQLLADGTISETTESKLSTTDTDMRNNFPFLLQADSRWGSTLYTITGDTDQTIARSGCGPTSMAMVLRSYGNNVTPIDTAKWSVDNGYRTEKDGTAWGFFNAIGKEYGLTTNAYSASQASSAFNDLNNDIPLIASMAPGDFTDTGHFITLVGRKDGNIVVNDPASTTRSDKTWPATTIQNQANEFWAISKNGKGSINNLTDAGPINLAGAETTEATIAANDASITEGSTSILSKYASFLSGISDTLMEAAMTGDWSATDVQSIVDLWNNAGTTSSTTSTTAATTTSGSYSTSTSGSDNEEKIWNYLTTTAGFSPAGAAGAMGNMYWESGLKPTAMEDWFESRLTPNYNDSTYTTAVDAGTYKTAVDHATYYDKSNYQFGGDFWNDKVGYGLIQWTSDDRKKGLYDAAKAANSSVGDIGVQLSYLMNEMNNSSYYKQAIPIMQSATDPYSAAGSWYKYIESGGGTMSGSQTKRGTKAQEIYNSRASGGSGKGLSNSGENDTKHIMMMPGGYGLSTGETVTGSAAAAREAIVGWMLCLIGRNTYTQSANRSRVMEGVDGNGYGDCSSTCCKIYETALGMSIGSYTGNMYNKGTQILGPNTERGTYPDESYMLPGDLVFYYSGTPDPNNLSSSIGHVEMYIGSGTLAGHGSGTGPKTKDMTTYRTSGSYGPWATVVRYLDESTTYTITQPDSSKYKVANQYTDGSGKSAGNRNVNAGATSTTTTSSASTTEATTFAGKYSNLLTGVSDLLMEGFMTGDFSGVTKDAVVNLWNGTSTSSTTSTTDATSMSTTTDGSTPLTGAEAIVKSADTYAATLQNAIGSGESWIYSNSSKYMKRSGSFEDMVRAADDGELQRGADEKMIPTWILRQMGLIGENNFVSGMTSNKIGGYVGSAKNAIDEKFDISDLSEEDYPTMAELEEDSRLRAGDILFGQGNSFVYRGNNYIFDSGHGSGNWTRKYSVNSDDDHKAVFTKWLTTLDDDKIAASTKIHHIMRPKTDFTTTDYITGTVALTGDSTASTDSSSALETVQVVNGSNITGSTESAAGEGVKGQKKLDQDALHAINQEKRHEGDALPSLRKRVTTKIGNFVDGIRGGKGGAKKVQQRRKGGYGLNDGVVSSNAATTGIDVADNMTASEASVRSSAFIGASQTVSTAIDKVISETNKTNSQDSTTQLLSSAIKLLQEIASNTSTSSDYLSQATELLGNLKSGSSTGGGNNVYVTQQTSTPAQQIESVSGNSAASANRNLALAQKIAAGK